MRTLPLATLTLATGLLGALGSSTSSSPSSYSSVTTDSASSQTGKVYALFSGETLPAATRTEATASEITASGGGSTASLDEESSTGETSVTASSGQAEDRTAASELESTTEDEGPSSRSPSVATSIVSESGQTTASGEGSLTDNGGSPSGASSTATRSAPTPDGTETSGERNSTSQDGGASSGNTTSEGYRNALYFANWGIYGADFHPQDLPVDDVTHILYSFANITEDGEVVSSDPYADIEKRYNTSSSGESDKDVHGCVEQMFLHKKRNRGLKVLLSIGGWSYSKYFRRPASIEAGRKRFASSAVKLMGDWGFDGLDIDWEYPRNATEARDFVLLLEACRDELDDYAEEYAPGYRFAITVASPAGPENYEAMDLEGMDPLVDAWHLMAYDYAGSWDKTSGHQAALYASEENKDATKFNTEDAVKAYMRSGIAAEKIAVGIPLYGRSFLKTAGLGKDYSGVGEGSFEKGIWLYKDLPRPGATEEWDKTSGASYSYDSSTKELVSYDTVKSATVKGEWVVEKGLGGTFFWEASGDRKGNESLVDTLAETMGKLDRSHNLLDYPGSAYANIRNAMGQGTSSNSTSSSSPTPSPSSTFSSGSTSAPRPTSASGSMPASRPTPSSSPMSSSGSTSAQRPTSTSDSTFALSSMSASSRTPSSSFTSALGHRSSSSPTSASSPRSSSSPTPSSLSSGSTPSSTFTSSPTPRSSSIPTVPRGLRMRREF